ncbi:MAG: hypothetical protein NT023_14735 [Armatimonadetes bacterium]|nr:hypothetical protein [Armatimonadota bacterium]
MKTRIYTLGLLTVGAVFCSRPVLAQQDPPIEKRTEMKSIRLRFENTEVSDILHALSLKTGTNIVLASNTHRTLSMNLTASTVEEALKTISSSAGMTYRLVDKSYIVATVAEMKQVMEASGNKVRVSLKYLAAQEAVKSLEGVLPFLTAKAVGDSVLLLGAQEDIVIAKSFLLEEDKAPIKEDLRTEVITIRNLVSSKLEAFLKSTYPKLRIDVVGNGEKPGGAVSITASKVILEEVKEALKRLDKPLEGEAGVREFKIYRIRYGSAIVLQDMITKAFPKIQVIIGPPPLAPTNPRFQPLMGLPGASGGSAGGSGGGAGGGAGGAGGGAGAQSDDNLTAEAYKDKQHQRSRSLILSGNTLEMEAAFHLIEQVDTPPQQVMVEVKVVDTSPEKAEQLGVAWNWSPLSARELPAGTPLDPATNAPLAQSSVPGKLFGAFSRVPFQMMATINAMVTNKEAKLLADPRIQVIDTLRTRISQAGLTGTNIQVLEFPVGIILLVRPRVHGDGRITLRVHPVVSTVTGINSDSLPQTSSREAETTVMLKDGETVVIGGLIREEISRTLQEVPLLSKLPLVGELFKNRSTSRRKSDIMIFITPRIVKDTGN